MKIYKLAFLLLFQFSFACNESLDFLGSSPVPDSQQKQKKDKAVAAPMVLKSIDGGQTWQDIGDALPELKSELKSVGWPKQNNVVTSEGVLIATGQKGIRRSTDNGEHWQWVISEGGVGIAVERINGGFAAISYNTVTNSRRIRISLDSGKAWQAIDEGLPSSSSISSIKQMGNYLICGHPDGIFRSSDMGKTWNKVHTAADEKEFKFLTPWDSRSTAPKHVFRIHVSGNVLYAIAVSAGC